MLLFEIEVLNYTTGYTYTHFRRNRWSEDHESSLDQHETWRLCPYCVVNQAGGIILKHPTSSCSLDTAVKNSARNNTAALYFEKMQLRCLCISAACMSSFYARTNLIQQSGHRNGIQNSWALPTICPICSTILQKPLNPILFFFFKLVTWNRAWSNHQKGKCEISSPLQWCPRAHRPLHIYI